MKSNRSPRPPGPAVFETIEVVDGQPFALDEHLHLLASAATTLGLNEPDLHRIRSAVSDTVRRWGEDPGRLRVTWSSVGRPGVHGSASSRFSLHLFVAPLIIPTHSARVEVSDSPINLGSPLTGLKSSGMTTGVAKLASYPGADEVLLFNESGELTEGTSSNVFVVRGDLLVTPPLSSGCRAGVTRAILVDAARSAGLLIREETILVDDLAAAGEAFLTSTGRHVQAIASISGRRLTPNGAGTQAAREAFLARRGGADQQA